MMRPRDLLRSSISYYWRTNVAVVLGVATAVAVLAGALLVGDSVRGSLRDLVLQRLGRTDHAILSSGFFREALADDLRADEAFGPSFASISPLIVVQGGVSEQASGRRASRVVVYGVDERFWRFHGLPGAPGPFGLDGRDALISRALASEIGAAADATVLVRLERPSAIPIESLHGRREDVGRSLRLTVRGVLGPESLGEFSLQPQQGEVRAIFVPLRRLQQDLDLAGRVNTLLVADLASADLIKSAPLSDLVRRRAALEDLELTLRPIESRHELALESAAGVMDDKRAAAAEKAAEVSAMQAKPVFTYLANTLRSGDRQVPYSLVTATDLGSIASVPAVVAGSSARPPIVLNDWTARDLRVGPGDPLTLEYFVWEEPGRLSSRTADFRIAAVVPIAGAAADRDFAPVYPGLTDADTIGDWDPPFPLDLRRVRPMDEDYWKQYRTTPKAFIPLEVGQALWRTRYGDRTSVRLVPASGQPLGEAREQYAIQLRTAIDPLAMGLMVSDVRESGLAASRGATDFGEYFTYFSFFLVLSSLLLAALFFRLGIEQRAREVGLLRAVGFATPGVRRLFMAEALVLVAIGSALGVAGALGYASGMMLGLRTWWAGAVGTTLLTLHTSWFSLAAGVAGAFVAALVCVWWTLRGLAGTSERSLLAGNLASSRQSAASSQQSPSYVGSGLPPAPSAAARPSRSVEHAKAGSRTVVPLLSGIGFGLLGAGLATSAAFGVLDRTAAFFGAGTSLLVGCLCSIAFTLRRPTRRPLAGRGFWPVARIGLRNAAARPGRSVLAIGVIASASFILISVSAFRRDAPSTTDPHSGVGGYALIVETLLPVARHPDLAEGRESLGLSNTAEMKIEPFRLLPGDDASCLNLYEPTRPRILGASRRFTESGRFAFAGSLASTDAERGNPWLLLDRDVGVDVVPVVADLNSMTYVLHRKIGEDFAMEVGGRLVRLRFVAALDDSIFQSELVMSDANFLKLFPDQEGYRFMLVEAPSALAAQAAEALEQGSGSDIGADAVSTSARLAEFHRVENTYLSTFQMLGGLGLLVGTIGLAAVLLRNVLERRRELALLGAVGYRRGHIVTIVLAENVLLLGLGLAVGVLCAVVAIAPAFVARGGSGLPALGGSGAMLVAVLAAGLLSSVIATKAALHTPLLDSLRAE
ncbi:MAG: ABC transporter permease [Vicinamibacterales bacterium]